MLLKNENQDDSDGDGVGDACDPLDDSDHDGDGIIATEDNCPNDPNPIVLPATEQADNDSDGMPDKWEKKQGLDPKDAADGNGDQDRDGYTNLESYLNSLVAENK